jgi:hypothetical protein
VAEIAAEELGARVDAAIAAVASAVRPHLSSRWRVSSPWRISRRDLLLHAAFGISHPRDETEHDHYQYEVTVGRGPASELVLRARLERGDGREPWVLVHVSVGVPWREAFDAFARQIVDATPDWSDLPDLLRPRTEAPAGAPRCAAGR